MGTSFPVNIYLMDFNDFTISNLEHKPDLVSQALDIIEKEFNYLPQYSFKTDFYPLFNKHNFQNCHVLLNKNSEVIAHIGQKKRILKKNTQSYDASLWGGIVVKKEFQGKGLFRKFFESLQAKENKETIQILWSGAPEIYYKFGFELKNQQYEYFQENASSEFFLKDKKSLSPKEFDKIKELYLEKSKKLTMFQRTERDWEEWFKVESADLYIYKKNDQIFSYFLINKGQDLKNIIHEHFIPPELFVQVRNHGNLWTAANEFPTEPNQISYLGLFKNDHGIDNLWINGIDSI